MNFIRCEGAFSLTELLHYSREAPRNQRLGNLKPFARLINWESDIKNSAQYLQGQAMNMYGSLSAISYIWTRIIGITSEVMKKLCLVFIILVQTVSALMRSRPSGSQIELHGSLFRSRWPYFL